MFSGICKGFPHVRQDEKEIQVAVIPDSPTEVIFVSPEKTELLTNVKQILDEMQRTTVGLPQNIVEQTTSTPQNTRKTRRPPKDKPKKERPLIMAYLDSITSTQPPPPPTANPNFGTYITNIEKLQIALTGMASDIDVMCDEKKSPSSLDPLRNPFILFLQNITQQQTDLTNTVLQYWTKVPGLALQPLTLPTIKPVELPSLQLVRSLEEIPSETLEIDEKLKGLENAIKKTIKEMLPYMNYIEQFPSENATPEEWERFNEAIGFVATRLKNKTIQQVLDKEKTKNLLENYEKYLSAVQIVKLYRDMEDGTDTSDAIKDVIKTRKGC